MHATMYACIHPLTTSSGAGATRATPWACWRRWRLVEQGRGRATTPQDAHRRGGGGLLRAEAGAGRGAAPARAGRRQQPSAGARVSPAAAALPESIEASPRRAGMAAAAAAGRARCPRRSRQLEQQLDHRSSACFSCESGRQTTCARAAGGRGSAVGLGTKSRRLDRA